MILALADKNTNEFGAGGGSWTHDARITRRLSAGRSALPGFSTGHLTLVPELRRREFDISGHPINACLVGRVFRIGRIGFALRGGRPEQSAGSLVNGVGLRLPSLRVEAHRRGRVRGFESHPPHYVEASGNGLNHTTLISRIPTVGTGSCPHPLLGTYTRPNAPSCTVPAMACPKITYEFEVKTCLGARRIPPHGLLCGRRKKGETLVGTTGAIKKNSNATMNIS